MDKSKAIRKFIGKKVRFDEYGGGYIWGDHPGEGEQMIAQVEDPAEAKELQLSIRGWGAIQHLFATAKEAGEFQDDLGKWIAEAINEKLEREEVSNG